MFINTVMIEPTTVSIAVYLLSKSDSLSKSKKLMKKNPIFAKKKLCKWFKKNKHTLLETSIDEFSDFFLDNINIFHMNPSIPLILYLIALIVIILF